MRSKVTVTSAVALLCLLSAFVLVSAECPNGCSGTGDCMAKDMCNCYKNYQGNDCGDRTCPFGRAFVDTPKGDINMDKDRLTPGWILTDSQQDPAGTYEHFSPDAAADEAHFYMECSNKGICDRSTGLCQCFDGYESAGCRRTTCPGKCSGHGTCESIRELGVKAAGTLFGPEGPSGAVKYDLWDGNSTYGCRCDPWYSGPDCSKRSCKVGVDPLFLGVGTPTYETFVVHGAATALVGGEWIRLRLFDYHGESYITKKIMVLSDAVTADSDKNVAAVTAAIQGIPNLTFKKVTCAAQGATAGYFSVRTGLGMSVVCQFSDNPGKMRIPEIASSGGFGAGAFSKVVTTTQQGFNDEWFTVQSGAVASLIAGTAVTSTTTGITAGTLVKIEDIIVLVTALAAPGLTLAFGVAQSIGTSAPVFTAAAGLLTVDAGTALAVAAAVGADAFIFATGVSPPFTAGDRLFLHNQFFTVQAQWLDGTPRWNVQLDKPFGGKSIDGTAAAVGDLVYKVTVSTDKTLVYKYVSECSGRGMCGTESGICTCFKGYTDDNCDTQSIIAL